MKPSNARTPTASAGLLKHAKKRTRAVVTKLRAAMRAMESEINEHEGIYPLNGGRLNQAELCRRAGISNVTLSTPAHRDTTHEMVDAWLTNVKKSMVTGRKNVRKAVTDRAEDWKRAHAAIAQNYRAAELEFLDMKITVKRLETEVQRLSDENSELRKELKFAGASKVVPLAKKGK